MPTDPTAPLRTHLVAAAADIAAHEQAATDLRDLRDALIYAGIDRFSTPGVAPGAWRGVGPWRLTAVTASGLSNGLFQRIERRRASTHDEGYWRYVGKGDTQRRLPDPPTYPGVTEHWRAVRDLNAEADRHDRAIDHIREQIRDPTLVALMPDEPDDRVLAGLSGLRPDRVGQIRLAARRAGRLAS